MALSQWLVSQGYHMQSDYMQFNSKQQADFREQSHHFCFYGHSAVLPQVIELHWRCRSSIDAFSFDPFALDAPLLKTNWDCIFTMNHLEQLIYLCVHGTEHRWYRLKWLLDLPMLMQHKNFIGLMYQKSEGIGGMGASSGFHATLAKANWKVFYGRI